MDKQSGRFLIFRIDLIALNIRISKYSLVIASSIVSKVMSFEFETAKPVFFSPLPQPHTIITLNCLTP